MKLIIISQYPHPYFEVLSKFLNREGIETILVVGERINEDIKSIYPSVESIHIIENIGNPMIFRNLPLDLYELLKSYPSAKVFFHFFYNYNLLKKISEIRETYIFFHDPTAFCPGGTKHWTFPKDKICPLLPGLHCCFLPYFFGCSGISRKRFESFLRYKIFRNIKELMPFFKRVFVASDYMRRELEKTFTNLPPISVAPLFPLHTHEYQPQKDGKIIFSAGRFSKGKGFEVFLKALSILKNEIEFKTLIAGDGYLKNRLYRLSKELRVDEKIEWKGWVSEKEMCKLYKMADIVVVPSVWPEPFGLVAVEAMAHSKPVICFNVGGLGEIVSRGGGIFAKYADPYDLAEKMFLLLGDLTLRERIAQKGHELIINYYTPENHINILLNALK
jgi:glycosyltransferase involved in cell wall biosynthesis